jgi:hypothetical protein
LVMLPPGAPTGMRERDLLPACLAVMVRIGGLG